MRDFFKRLFCRQQRVVSFVRNVYGDEINVLGGCRSLWRCKRCGAVLREKLLNPPSPDVATKPQEGK